MNFFTAIDVSASGLEAQRTRLNIVAMNLSNMHATRTAKGGPYRRKIPIFSATPVKDSFGGRLRAKLAGDVEGVRVIKIVEDRSELKKIFDPSHPDADKFGYVLMPNVNLMQEMVSMLAAKRSYEANVAALSAAKGMAIKSLELLK